MDNKDNLENLEDAKKFLRSLGLHVDEDVVRKIVNVLVGKVSQSWYSFYASRDGKPPPICGKGTVDKIKKLYKSGQLGLYIDYLNQEATKESEKGQTSLVPLVTKDKEIQLSENNQLNTIQPPINSPETNINFCSASPEGLDVRILKEWGIPKKAAPHIMFEWNKNHNKGLHDECIRYKSFIFDVHVNKIPYDKALAISFLESQDDEFDAKSGETDADIARKYRPWESKENLDVSFKAMGIGVEPSIDLVDKDSDNLSHDNFSEQDD